MGAFSASNSLDTRVSKDEPTEKRQKCIALDILLGLDVNSSTVLTARDKLKLYMPESDMLRERNLH